MLFILEILILLQVTDEEGRRRFHGAFTGGFSAGYYNTVGSKEGIFLLTFILETDITFFFLKKKTCKPAAHRVSI